MKRAALAAALVFFVGCPVNEGEPVPVRPADPNRSQDGQVIQAGVEYVWRDGRLVPNLQKPPKDDDED